MQLSSDPTTRQAQLTGLKNYVNTNYAGAFDTATVNAMNQTATPDFWVWKPTSTIKETGMAASPADAGNITGLNADRIQSFAIQRDFIEPSIQTHRAFWGDVYSSKTASLDGFVAEWQRLATIAEKVLATGTGSQASNLQTDGSVTGAPATLGDGAVGEITLRNLIDADTFG